MQAQGPEHEVDTSLGFISNRSLIKGIDYTGERTAKKPNGWHSEATQELVSAENCGPGARGGGGGLTRTQQPLLRAGSHGGDSAPREAERDGDTQCSISPSASRTPHWPNLLRGQPRRQCILGRGLPGSPEEGLGRCGPWV